MLLLQNKVYAVTAAHLLFNKEAQSLYQLIPCNIDSVRQNITDPAKKIVLRVPGAETTSTSCNVFDVTEPRILLAFRYRPKSNEEQQVDCKQFMNDSVFFEIDENQAVRWQDQLKHSNPCHQEKLYRTDLKRLKDLHERRQDVVVKSLKGKLSPTFCFKSDLKNDKALSLTFALEKNGQGTP